MPVDTWKKLYDKEDKLHEEKGVKKTMIEVLELKYLGFVIESSASNVPNITERNKKSMSTPKNIMKMTHIRGRSHIF